MLNPGFPKQFESSEYILNNELVKKVITNNSNFDTEEDRFDDVYTFEIWKKLECFNIKPESLSDLEVLDICAGSGFLSYHILKNSKPKKITLLDISQKEINHAKVILSEKYPDLSIEYVLADFLNSEHKKQYDLIIGNSFLHHFYNLPDALLKIKSMLKPGGIFVALHEPTIASFALESRNPLALIKHIIYGKNYIELFRKIYSVSPHGVVGGDVWMFTIEDLKKMFKNAAFIDIDCRPCNLFRSIIVAYSSFVPGCKFIKLKLLKLSIIFDQIIYKFLPEKFFGSTVSFVKKDIIK
ncbi:MAG: methyltransferase domain-containing protein [Candidatus Magasanikiibacteriota bacterium]